MKLLIALAAGVALYFVQLLLYRRYWDRDLNISVDFARSVVREGDENELVEIISNDKRLPLPVLQVKFALTRSFIFPKQDNSKVTDQYYRNDYYSLMPYQKITRRYGFTCSKRGYYMMNGMDVICKDLFLSGMMLRTYEHEASVCVLPLRLPVQKQPVRARELMGEITDRIRKNEDPFEFAGIREYRAFDPMNRINWKASASAGELRVNKFDTTFSQRVVICLNLECHIRWHEDVFVEEEIRIAAALAEHFISVHIPVSLVSNGRDIVNDEPVRIGAGADAAHLHNIEISLARLDERKEKTSFIGLLDKCCEDREYDNTEYILISNYRKQDLVDAYGSIKNRGINVSWIIPEYRMVDPKLTQLGDNSIIKWTVSDAR